MKHLKKFNENNNDLLDSKLDEVYEILKEEIKSFEIDDFYEAESYIHLVLF